MKFAIINRIGASNWEPTNHSLVEPLFLLSFYSALEPKSKLNFREYVFEKTMKNVDSFTVKKLITFQCLLTRIILNNHPKVLHP